MLIFRFLNILSKIRSRYLRVNAVSLNCGTREVEEVKKRSKNAKTAVTKKESKRKSGLQKTGGGPPVDVTFRPWELDVSISGLRNPYVSILF